MLLFFKARVFCLFTSSCNQKKGWWPPPLEWEPSCSGVIEDQCCLWCMQHISVVWEGMKLAPPLLLAFWVWNHHCHFPATETCLSPRFLPTCSLIGVALVLGPLCSRPYWRPGARYETAILYHECSWKRFSNKGRNCPLCSMLEQSLSQSTHSKILAERMNKWINAM